MMPGSGAPHDRSAIIAALFCFGAIIRLAALATQPPLSIDEVRYLVVSHHLRTGIGYNDWRGPETHVHPLHPALTALSGQGLASLEARGRRVTEVFSILLLVPLSALAWRVGGRLTAGIVLVLAGANPWLVRPAASVQPESLHAFLAASGVYFLLPRAGERLSVGRWAAGGVAFGLGYLARPEGFLVGLLAGTIAFLLDRRAGTIRPAGPVLFVAMLLLTSSPYLLFLREATGGWTLSGKTAHVFFVDQAIHSVPDPEDAMGVLDDLKHRYGTIVPYVVAHPWFVIVTATKNALRIALSAVPRALGPAGLLGLAACAVVAWKRKELRGPLLLVASPCLTLLFLVVSYPNERVLATTVPFLLLAASVGLGASAERVVSRGRRVTIAAVVVLALAATAGWAPAVRRAWVRLRSGASGSMEVQAVERALKEAGPGGGLLTDYAVLSFYAGDPRLFGPPGRWRPLPYDATCSEAASLMRQEGVRVAILDLTGRPPRVDLAEPGCPLSLELRLADPAQGRVILVLTLPAEPPPRSASGQERSSSVAPRG